MLFGFQANFESDVRSKYLELLGYNKEDLALKVSDPITNIYIYIYIMSESDLMIHV